MKKLLAKVLPASLTNPVRSYRESKVLSTLPTATCNLSNLRSINDTEIQQIFANEEFSKRYKQTKSIVDKLAMPEYTGGVNIGDQRALFHLISHFKPERVLEVGTFIGCSTVHIALALKQNSSTARMTTVDINDVNDVKERPWVKFGSDNSPYENLVKADCSDIVSFVNQRSMQYLGDTDGEKFDFIFLDGNHASNDVYPEVSKALDRLQPNGIILLHDYFPDNKPLWDTYKHVISGPYLAMERFKREGNNIAISPLGSLPWSTKYNTNITTLALCHTR